MAITKLSKGQEAAFKPQLFATSGTGYDTIESYTADMNAIAQPITLKLIKTEREFRASLNFEGQKDDKGQPIWTTTDAVSSLRPPKLLMLTTGRPTTTPAANPPSLSTRSPSTCRESEALPRIGTFARRLALRKDL